MTFEWSNVNGNLLVDNSVATMDGSGGYHGPVQWSYIHLRDGVVIVDPSVGFYRNPPPDAQCRWSTNNGRNPPQHFDKKQLHMPRRELTVWNDDRLKTAADKYKKKFWRELKTLTRPNTFLDLYNYFDAVTLWFAGAYNLWNMINMLVTEAHQRWPALLEEWKQTVDKWVHELLYEWDGFAYNQNALKQWNGRGDPLTTIPFNHMYNVGFEDLGPQETNLLREALFAQYYLLTDRVPYVPTHVFPYYPRPFDGVPTAPSDTTSKAAGVHSKLPSSGSLPKPAKPTICCTEPQVPHHPSPSATLTSIPEEAENGKVETVIIDTVSNTSSSIDKVESTNTKSEVPVPEVDTKETASQSENIRDRKDSNGSTDEMFFNSRLSFNQVEARDRQLSVNSAPDEESEPMLSTTADIKTCITSEAPTILKDTDRPKHTFPQKLDTSALDQTNKQGSYRGNRKSPARNGPIQRRPSANTPLYRPTNQIPQQGPRMGISPPHIQGPSPPHLHFGTSNGIPPPPPSFGPGMTGMPPNSNHFPHLGPSPPHGAGMLHMGPPMGPPAAFHDQLPIPPHSMDQSQFNHHHHHHQRHPSHISPQYISLQNPGPLSHQRNGYTYQSKKDNNSQGGIKNTGNRHDSFNSNESHKVRDDPVHGAVYILRQPETRKNSNASSGRRSSIANSLEAEHGRTGPQNQCNNSLLAEFRDYNELFNRSFRECSCHRCDEATRSVYVKHFDENLKDHQIKDILMKHFEELSPSYIQLKSSGKAALVVFRTDTDAIRAIQDLRESKDKRIHGLSKTADVWYPIFSKHYTPKSPENPHGFPRRALEVQVPGARRPSNSMPRRDSNPFRNQRPKDMPNNPPPLPEDHPVYMHQPNQHMPNHEQPPRSNTLPGTGIQYQPIPPHQQRRLWEPSVSPHRENLTPTFPTAVEQGQSLSSNTRKSEGRMVELLLKEDWRSKPPSEEIISDTSYDVAVTDTTSNHSSQGVRSIKVCLPNESGSSRSASPEIDSQICEQVHKDSNAENYPKFGKKSLESASTSRTVTPEVILPAEKTHSSEKESISPMAPAETVDLTTEINTTTDEANPEKAIKKNLQDKDIKGNVPKNIAGKSQPKQSTDKKASSYRKTMTDLASPIDKLEQTAPGSGSYRKTAAELSSAAEAFYCQNDSGTVIRRKQPRSPLPKEWAYDTSDNQIQGILEGVTYLSRIGDRFSEISQKLESAVAEDSSDTMAANADENQAVQVSDRAADAQQQPKKKGKGKKGSAQDRASQCNTPTDIGSRGPSPSFHQPSLKSVTTNASSSRCSSPVVHNNDDVSLEASQQPKKKKNNNRNKKRKITQAAPELSKELAQGGDKQGIQSHGARLGSPKKNSKMTEECEPAGKHVTAGSPTQGKVSENMDGDVSFGGSNKENSGGSLRMRKIRSPKKAGEKDISQEPKSSEIQSTAILPITFELPTKEAKDVSPDANSFQNQKSTIDELRKMGGMPNLQQNTTSHVSVKNSAVDCGRMSNSNSCPRISSDTTSRSWSGIVKSEDPFTTVVKVEVTAQDLTKSKGIRSPQMENKRIHNTSPTPSPKKSQKSTQGKKKLSAIAQSFVKSNPASPATRQLKLNPTAQPFTIPLPSSPAPSVVSVQDRTANCIKVEMSRADQPAAVVTYSARPTTETKNIPRHAKKPSLPGQPSGVDKRFVTPADQVLDPKKVAQPGPPMKEKKATGNGSRNGPLPNRNPNSIPITSTAAEAADDPKAVPPQGTTPEVIKIQKEPTRDNSKANKVEPAKTGRKTAAEVASASVPSMNNNNFPTLGEAATADPAGRKRRAASIVKSGIPVVSSAAIPATAPKQKLDTKVGGPSGPVSRERVVSAAPSVPATADTKQQKKQGEGDGWRIVSSSKKSNNMATRGGGRGGWRGGRGRGPVSEDRKGG